MKSIVWGNYKGGVGKTTSVFQVATYFAEKGKKVLLIDLDPQCSLSNICCNGNSTTLDKFKSNEVFNYVIELYISYINSKKDMDYDILYNDIVTSPIKNKLSDLCVELKETKFLGNLYFIPSSISFDGCRLNELSQKMEKNIMNVFLMQLFYNDISDLEFDYIFVDCPPTSNLLIQSSFLASDYYIVPTIVDEISTKGVPDYITEIEKTGTKFIMNSKIGGILVEQMFKSKIKFVGVFETIYKERRGNADNRDQVISLDKNIEILTDVKSLVSEDKNMEYRYSVNEDEFQTKNIFKEYIANKDNRSNGESIPVNTSYGVQTNSYEAISLILLRVLEE